MFLGKGLRWRSMDVERIHTWAFYLLCGFALFSNISIAAANVFLGTLVAVLLLRVWRKHDDLLNALPDGRICAALLTLMGAIVFTSLFSSDVSHSLRTFGDYYGYRMIGLYAVLLMVWEKRRLALIALLVGVSFALNGLVVLFQGLMQGNMRADGFSFSMTTGGFLSMLIPALVLLLLSGRMEVRYRLPAAIALGLGCLALLFNGTRGAWLGVPITVFFCAAFLVREKKKFLAGALAVLLVFAGIFALSPALSSRFATIGDMKMQSNSERLLLWTSATHMFEDHPAVGIGFARFKAEYQEHYILPEAKERELTHAHNNIMHMLAECGAIGILALFFFWWACFSYGFGTWRTTHHIAALLIPAVLLGLLLQGLTEYNMGNSAVMKLHWLLMGLCLQWLRLDGEARRLS